MRLFPILLVALLFGCALAQDQPMQLKKLYSDLDANSHKITGLTNGSNAQDAITYSQLHAYSGGTSDLSSVQNQTMDRYILATVGTKYVTYNQTGHIIDSQTNFTTLFNSAMVNHRKITVVGDYQIGAPLLIYQKEDIQIEFQGTLTPSNSYGGYYYHGRSMIALRDSDNIILRGGTIDGRKSATRTGATVEVLGLCNNILIENMIIKECDQMALCIGDSAGANTEIIVRNVLFDNNTDLLNNPDEDVYSYSAGTNVLFDSCTWQRSALGISTSQALYMENCTGTYLNCHFHNIAGPFDFRHGTHRVIGAHSTVSTYAVSVSSIYDIFPYNPKVTISDSEFTGMISNSGLKSGVVVGFGSLTLQNVLLEGTRSTYDYYGIKLGDNYGTNSTNCIIENCLIKGYKTIGIRVTGSYGGHVFSHNDIYGATTGIGFEMHHPKKYSFCSYNNFTGVTTKYSFISTDKVNVTDPDNGY